MDSSSIPAPNIPANIPAYQFVDGDKLVNVDPSRNAIADKIDIMKKDRIIDRDELLDYMRKTDILRDPEKCSVDEEKIVQEFKDFLQNKPLVQATGYHTYDETVQELKALTEKRPDLCEMVSLGKSVEGRDIWALKISKKPPAPPQQPGEPGNPGQPGQPGAPGDTPPGSKDTSDKPGVVFTGVWHAREWIGLEVVLALARGLVENYDTDPAIKARVDNSEIWTVPIVNPDGYTYSREVNSWWRKNRNPITHTGCETNFEGNICPTGDETVKGIGVDLNRNCDDGVPEHHKYWRPPGDEPCNFYDDFYATSDDPEDDTYRGPEGASENETKAVLDLCDRRPNIKGVIDFHSYGQLIMYPWGDSYDPVENIDIYKELGQRLNASMGNKYRVMQSSDLYPCSGSSENVHHLNKRITFTIELARSFQPAVKDIEPICRDLYGVNNTFIDWVIENKDSIPWPDPAPPQPPPPQQPKP